MTLEGDTGDMQGVSRLDKDTGGILWSWGAGAKMEPVTEQRAPGDTVDALVPIAKGFWADSSIIRTHSV